MHGYYLGIDQGTTLTTAVIADENWRVVAKASKAHRQIFPHPGWVEHDAVEIYENCLFAIKEAVAKAGINASELLCMGLDHQGETCVIWNKYTGIPIYNAIVWQDRRTADVADRIKREHGEMVHHRSGMLPDAYHSATKLRWLLDNVPGAQAAADKGDLIAGTLNTWLIWKFTGGAVHVTEACSANRTMLMDIRKTCWDDELFELAGLPKNLLPPIHSCNEVFGYTDPDSFIGVKIPISGSSSDSPAGLIGGGVTEAGSLKTSYGTGSFMNLQTGDKLVLSDKGLFSSVCWKLGEVPYYTVFGSMYIAGAAVQWLRDGIHIVDDVRDTEKMANSVKDTNDVYFVPALAGLASPYWDQYARGLFIGLTSSVTREHMVRAVLESVTYQVANCFAVMTSEYGGEIKKMRADGGMVDNGFVMQLQADMLGIPVEVPEDKETAAFGAACLASYTIGGLSSLEDVKKFVKIKKVYEPEMSADERAERLARWLEAVERSREWVHRDSK